MSTALRMSELACLRELVQDQIKKGDEQLGMRAIDSLKKLDAKLWDMQIEIHYSVEGP